MEKRSIQALIPKPKSPGAPLMARQAKSQGLLTHEQIWSALDRLAARASLSPSGLARRAGLDPTTFNKSKRVTADGRERWPSTESVAKALAAADASIDTLVELMGLERLGDGLRHDTSPATAIRRGDRVVVKTSDGEVVIGELKRRIAKLLELEVAGAAAPGERIFAASDVEWIARIVWVRQ
jgi:phage repressor protein C with HTH and peptisase S24 domain